MALGSRKLTENEECLPSTVVSAPWSAPLSEHDKKYFGGSMTLACTWERVWIREEMPL